MKVLKFGGTSVGSIESILSLKSIVESETQPVIVVVSALGGITDKLIAISQQALTGDEQYKEEFENIVKRHHHMVENIIKDETAKKALLGTLNDLFDQLRSIYYGVFLIHDLSAKTQATIVSYGERLSSHIVGTLIKNGKRMNSRDFIKTINK